MRILILSAVFFLLSGCEQIASFEKGVIEPRVDVAYDEVIQRLCSFPADVAARAISRNGREFYLALVELCPNTFGLFHSYSITEFLNVRKESRP